MRNDNWIEKAEPATVTASVLGIAMVVMFAILLLSLPTNFVLAYILRQMWIWFVPFKFVPSLGQVVGWMFMLSLLKGDTSQTNKEFQAEHPILYVGIVWMARLAVFGIAYFVHIWF